MHYTIFILSIFSLFKLTDAKAMPDNEDRQRLLTLAEILDATAQAEDKQPQFNAQKSDDNFVKFENFDNQRIIEPRILDEILFPPQNSKRSSNLFKLANQAARGFGK